MDVRALGHLQVDWLPMGQLQKARQAGQKGQSAHEQ